MNYTNTYTVSSFATEDGSGKRRFTVYEDTIPIYETGSEQDAKGYADALNANAARGKG